MLPLNPTSELILKTIVIVDDGAELAQLYKQVLELEGYQVFLAGSGEEALELLSRIPPPDLLLVDCLMPGMSGVEFLRALEARHQAVFEKTPIVGLSGLYRECSILQEMKPLVCRLAEKPSDVDEVINLVRETIRH